MYSLHSTATKSNDYFLVLLCDIKFKFQYLLENSDILVVAKLFFHGIICNPKIMQLITII